MSSIDALARRVQRLQGRTSDERLEEEWAGICAGAKESLLAELEEQIARNPEPEPRTELSVEDRATFEELHAWLTESAEQSKQAWMRLKRSGWKA